MDLFFALQNYTTYLFRTNIVLERKGYVYRSLEKFLPQEVTNNVVGMRFTKDKMVRNYTVQECTFFLPSQLMLLFVLNKNSCT